MSIRWDWKNKIGELDIQQGERTFTMSLYEGNALLIILYETGDTYRMHQFFADKDHFKNCKNDKEWNYAEEWREIRLWVKPSADLWKVIEDCVKRGVSVHIVSKPTS